LGNKKDALKEVILESIFEKKGQEVVKISFNEDTSVLCDSFIICHGDSTTQVNAIADGIQRKVKENLKIKAGHIEGSKNAYWIIIDYYDIVIHIFLKEYRDYYNIEGLWGDADMTMVQDNKKLE
jgi:ribosome-associated protein